jgi:hypothetical protein
LLRLGVHHGCARCQMRLASPWSHVLPTLTRASHRGLRRWLASSAGPLGTTHSTAPTNTVDRPPNLLRTARHQMSMQGVGP